MLEKMLLVDRASQLAKDQPRDGTALFSDILRDIYTPVTDGWSSLDCVMQESTEKIDFLKYMTKQVFPEEEDYFLKQMGKELYDEEINSGASEKEIYELVTTAKEKWNMEIPQQYLDVLSRINGIEFNGFILYGVDQYLLEHEMKQTVCGFLEFNHIWHENEKQREYLFLGESNISWYVYQYKNQCYMELDQPSRREIHRFRNFYEMFDKVLSEAIMG